MRLLRWMLALLLATLLLASCSATSDSAGGDDGGPPDVQEDWAGADGGGDSAGDVPADADGSGADREVVTTGSVSVVVDDVRAAADDVTRIVEATGGWVDERTEQAGDDDGEGATAWLTVRVPSGDLTATLESLDELGDTRDLSISSTDVTRQSQDLDARIRALETSAERLLTLMADAETSADLLAAESALSDRQAELESLQSQRAYLSDQVALSTLEIGLFSERAAPQLEPGGFLGGLSTGWNALVSFVSGLLVATGVLLPWLVVLAIAAAAAVPLLRARRRGRSGQPVSAPAGAAAAPNASETPNAPGTPNASRTPNPSGTPPDEVTPA